VTDFPKIQLSDALTFTLRSMPRGKQYPGTITHVCDIPFKHISIDHNSDCFLCHCEGWLPVPVGKVLDFTSMEDVWNSPMARMLQQDIVDKKFSWCAVQHCGILEQDIVWQANTLHVNIDDSCNLACPSCRRELRMLERGPDYDAKIRDLNRIIEWLDKFSQPIMISLGGTGDALASHVFRHFIKKYRYKPGQTFQITTNGLLLKKVIANSSIQPAITSFSISVDAATPSVYENVRRPGKWSVLLDNLEWLANHRNQCKIVLKFVVQRGNFRDLPVFAELCKKYNFFGYVLPLNDWGTWNSRPVENPDTWTIANGTFLDHNVTDPVHPEHNEFLDVLRNLKKQNHNLLTLNPFFNQFQ
jgi:sulfatase maturation enzyme AslB (radical SAM superfamily)